MSDAEQYLDLWTRLDAALHQLRGILLAHAQCPGCPLCRDCQDRIDTLDVFFDVHCHELYRDAANTAPRRTFPTLYKTSFPPEHLSAWLKESAVKLRMLRDAVKQEYAKGNLADSLLDVATVMALVDPLAAAMMRLSKRKKASA